MRYFVYKYLKYVLYLLLLFICWEGLTKQKYIFPKIWQKCVDRSIKTVIEIATKTHFWLSIKVVTMVLLVYNGLIVIMNPIRKQFAWQKLVFPSQPRVGPPLAIIANDCITTLQSSGII